MAGGMHCLTGSCSIVCAAIGLVGNTTLLNHFCDPTPGRHSAAFVQGGFAIRLSPAQHRYETCNVGWYLINVIFYFISMQKIILASQSPRRKQLLEWAEIEFEVMVSNVDETIPAGLPFDEAAISIARAKAVAIAAEETSGLPVLAADTIVVCGTNIIGKPKDREAAITTLTELSGKTHKVITGVIILMDGQEVSFADTTSVTFHDLTHEQIVFYVDKYQPYDKAGAYAIQEWIGVVGIKCIEGDFYNVMGLPVSRVLQVLTLLQSQA